MAEKIRTGSTEQKRDALFQLRNLETAEASRIAIPALQDSNEIVRVTATYSIIYLPSDEAAQVLLPLLQDKSPFVRKETCYALGKTKNPLAVQPLLEILQKDKFPEVKVASVIALGEIGEVGAIDFLLKILQNNPKDSEVFLRRSAARSIGQIAQIQQIKLSYVVTPESLLPEKYDTFANLKYSNLAETNSSFQKSVSVLLSILKNEKESDDVRREAAFALGTIGDKSVIANLQNNLSAKDYYLAEICKEGLAKISK
ncbi:MAG: HEAT repeat domain-containing protein [Pyrinomonadaceae bacterium]|nr:HEAT repeat domain-containing protein [Pyrinomonadaceae bacterium]